MKFNLNETTSRINLCSPRARARWLKFINDLGVPQLSPFLSIEKTITVRDYLAHCCCCFDRKKNTASPHKKCAISSVIQNTLMSLMIETRVFFHAHLWSRVKSGLFAYVILVHGAGVINNIQGRGRAECFTTSKPTRPGDNWTSNLPRGAGGRYGVGELASLLHSSRDDDDRELRGTR